MKNRKNRKKKMFKRAFSFMIFAGFFFLFGTTGSAEIDAIGIGQMIVQYLIGGAVIGIGYIGLKVIGCNNIM